MASRFSCVWLIAFMASLFLQAMLPPPAVSQSRSLNMGAIDFPTSGTPEAQRHFLRGVAAMHSFWYEVALEAFRESTRVQPDFVMGYWGEAMVHNHPVWNEQKTEAARAVLRRIPKMAQATQRERAYLQAVSLLYGEGSKEERDRAYAAAMEQLHRDYPEDLEAACFYALALLGVAEHEPRGSRTHIRAGAVALDVFTQNPSHPGAAHYTIHAFDDPDHAILALPAARRYAQSAPDVPHAVHMPGHIFLQLGMWPEAAAAIEADRRTALEFGLRTLPPNESLLWTHLSHSLHWLHYVYLQQGRHREAAELLDQKQSDMNMVLPRSEKHATPSEWERRLRRDHETMIAAHILETQEWEAAEKLLPDPRADDQAGLSALHEFTRGYAAARMGSASASKSVASLRRGTVDKQRARRGKFLPIRALALEAVVAASAGNLDEAIAHARQAADLDGSLGLASGPPRTIKPPHELLGELLLAAGRPDEARRSFETALFRHPKRARAMLGAARAAAESRRHDDALRYYRQLLAIWTQADPGLRELEEARRYVQGANISTGVTRSPKRAT